MKSYSQNFSLEIFQWKILLSRAEGLQRNDNGLPFLASNP